MDFGGSWFAGPSMLDDKMESLLTLPEQKFVMRYMETLNPEESMRHAGLDPAKVGLGVSVFVQVSLEKQVEKALEGFERAIRACPEVMECYLTTGGSDYVLRVVAHDAADFERLHSKVLTKLPGVARVESSFVLRPATLADTYAAKAGETPEYWARELAAIERHNAAVAVRLLNRCPNTKPQINP